ncbi:hypothetical protein HDU76_010571 [Blyttiomyces sp. JEL0837]|nr:hypothetical protein HDU76_010571 [Blyttiomyces sp. JEL0837]
METPEQVHFNIKKLLIPGFDVGNGGQGQLPSGAPEKLPLDKDSTLNPIIRDILMNHNTSEKNQSTSTSTSQEDCVLETSLQRTFGSYYRWDHRRLVYWAGQRRLGPAVIAVINRTLLDGAMMHALDDASLHDFFGIEDSQVRNEILRGKALLTMGYAVIEDSVTTSLAVVEGTVGVGDDHAASNGSGTNENIGELPAYTA